MVIPRCSITSTGSSVTWSPTISLATHARIAPAPQVIRRLRDLEMPLADVKAVVAATDSAARNALIAAHLERLEVDLARTREAISSLRNLITRPPTALEVEHRTVPSTPAIAIHEIVDRSDILSWWQGALGELQANGGTGPDASRSSCRGRSWPSSPMAVRTTTSTSSTVRWPRTSRRTSWPSTGRCARSTFAAPHDTRRRELGDRHRLADLPRGMAG